MTYKLGSLFDGSGGFPLAGSLCGIEPVWASEVEPYPIAVTRSRFPKMKHLGDISKINGAEVEPVDIITFGSPCQDLSVAGKRAGLKHEDNGDDETTRSGLFMEAVRIIKEMREATNGAYPRFALWENVPGAFSSNKGEDFRIVLEELIKVVEPTAVMPSVPKNGWPYADSYCGDGWSLAYRVFDAQFWGVPQRRRRIYLVADFRGQCAGEVSFKREGVRGYFETGRTPWKEVAGDAESGIGTANREGNGLIAVATQQGGEEISENGVCPTITAAAGMSGNNQPWIAMEAAGFKHLAGAEAGSIGYQEEIATTLLAGVVPAAVYSVENHPADSRVNIDDSGKVQTLTSRMVTGGGNVPMVMEPVAYNGENITSPLNKANPQPGDPFHTLGTDSRNYVVIPTAYAMQGFGDYKESDVAVRYIVRRLTPTECARLQGFPDKWGHPDQKEDFTDEEYRFWLDVRNTHATVIGGKEAKEYTKEQMLTWYNKLHTDSAEYKMWGNGISLPTALYCLQGMAEVLNAEEPTAL